MSDWEVIVIGGGAAGLLAAIRAAERRRKTLLIEKNKRPGVKILMSGGTRCNLTHACDPRGIVEAFGVQGKFLHSALAALGPRDLVEMIEAEGVPTKVEPTGKIFPVSDRAADVLAALLLRLERSGCGLATGEAVRSVELDAAGSACELFSPLPAGAGSGVRGTRFGHSPHPQPLSRREWGVETSECRRPAISRQSVETGTGGTGSRFRVATDRCTYTATSVAITTGGCSYPGSGTTGDGYAWAERFGHTIVPPRPALVPVTTDAAWVHALKGLTVPDVRVSVRQRSRVTAGEADVPRDLHAHPQTNLSERRGPFLFTHFGLSGPAVLDVSRAVTGHADPAPLDLVCNFLPSVTDQQLNDNLKDAALAVGGKPMSAILPGQLPRRLLDALLKLADVAPDLRCAELGKAARGRVVRVIKECQIPITGTMGLKKAEVTAGGLSLAEVDSRTMQSRLVPNLYLAGEILDLDGPIGGYNFQAAFSTGWLAGGYL